MLETLVLMHFPCQFCFDFPGFGVNNGRDACILLNKKINFCIGFGVLGGDGLFTRGNSPG